MNLPPPSSRQPVHEIWSWECLLHERNIALGSVLEPSSLSSYTSAVQSYVTFCRNHDFPIDPTTDTLSFYVIYICHFIKPKSVSSYLSGICNQLEVFYPDIRRNCAHPIVAKKLHTSIASRKRPLQRTELTEAFNNLHSSSSFDGHLFLALLYIGFFALMRLGELVFPDRVDLQDFRKVIMRDSFLADAEHLEFNLPMHKADQTFEGNRIVNLIQAIGRWASESFKIYIRTHPVLLTALLFSQQPATS
ncbi:uncharacterized protein C8R40DRAFT_1163227 [Lentinula edodes]|uniref:uncharacterized protein n=1 Tax=Lentinula edodes TaxID=5353 RepID=UPI001E8DE8A4|nr:uncharacterized protein C8R40DRAFT_1163227 [Lentinula edodes]KAH7870145.1 hypothetical protein C8R40DRAFT_1163227 [Lentinula edodes]